MLDHNADILLVLYFYESCGVEVGVQKWTQTIHVFIADMVNTYEVHNDFTSKSWRLNRNV